MGNCLITKLNGSVSNDKLLKIAEMRIYTANEIDPSSTVQFNLTSSANQTLTALNGGYFLDASDNHLSTLSLVAGTSTAVKCVVGTTISVEDKYSLTSILAENVNIKFDVGDLEYATAFASCKLKGTNAFGDIKAFSNKSMTTASYNFNNTKLKGDIANLTSAPSYLYISDKDGDYNSLYGSIDAFHNSSVLEMSIFSNLIVGDISKLNTNFTSLKLRAHSIVATRQFYGNFTWSSRAANSKLITMFGVNFSDTTSLNTMLSDQANCSFTPSGTSSVDVIDVAGTTDSSTLGLAKALVAAHSGLNLYINRTKITASTQSI